MTSLRGALGLDLPPRAAPLGFKFPALSQRLQAQSGLGLAFDAKLKRAQEDPTAVFELIKDRVKHLNRCALSTRQRQQLTNEVTQLFFEPALQVCHPQPTAAAVPEPAERRKRVLLAAEISHILMVSNQILFNSYYQLSNFQFQRARAKFQQAGVRVMELFQLTQQLKALRYQLPDQNDWRALHTVLHTLQAHDRIDQPRRTLKHQLGLESPQSVASLFIGAVIFDFFKPLQWPTQLQWVTLSYLKSVAKSVRLVFQPCHQPARRDVIATPAPLSATQPESSQVVLDCAVLFTHIRTDCLALIKALRSKKMADVPARLAKFKEQERLVVAHTLLHALDQTAPEPASEHSHPLQDLRLFVGFSGVFALLQHQQGEFAHEERLADALAKRSAIMAQDHHSGQSTLWTLVHETPSRIRLSTQESSYTTPLSVGSLLAYGMGEAIKHPCLAVVARLERVSSNTVLLDLAVLSHYAEPVVITLHHHQQNVGHRALLIASQNIFWRWGLLLPPMDVLPGVDEFVMIRQGQPMPLDLETLRMATPDFSLFSTQLSTTELGFDAVPNPTQPSLGSNL
ncbi:hypothetical protein [Rhodoferax sp.]|uniref:hypothetical protein n=1 Tax=Rhodoferax sp. TaxID=50421 RepID=UPI002637943D|nr:hypothetical protein [Rhodoferax sp.]MDD5478788.1 hypothetical protein [Rhodoferax sp.]